MIGVFLKKGVELFYCRWYYKSPPFFSRFILIEWIKDKEIKVEKTSKKKLTSMNHGGILIDVADRG